MRNLITLFKISTTLALATVALQGCDNGQPEPSKVSGPPQVQLSEAERQQLAQTTRQAWQMAGPVLEQTIQGAQQLLDAVEALLAEPTAANLSSAQEQWRQTALHYQPLKLYAHVAELQPGPFQVLQHLTFAVAAEPIQPGYLDSFGPYPYSGLVHDISLAITPETLREQHGMTNEEDASLGLYAMQFMLFGAPGESRPASDFAVQELTDELRQQGFALAEELPANRRRQLLLTQAQLLVEDLQHLYSLWQPDVEQSLYGVFTSYTPLHRYLVLLRSARLELSQVLTELGEIHQTQATTQQPEDAATAPAKAVPAPPDFLAARLSYVGELAKTLELDDDLQQNLQQAQQWLAQVRVEPSAEMNEPSAEEAIEQAVAAVTKSMEQLTAELQAYAPDTSPEADGA